VDIESLKKEVKAKLLLARDIADRAENEKRGMTEAEQGQITSIMGEANGLVAQIKSAGKDDELRASLKGLEGIGLVDPSDRAVRKTANGLIIPDLTQKSLGEYFTESQVWNNFQNAHAHNFGEKTRVQTDAVAFKSLVREKTSRKALVTGGSDTSAGAYVQNQWLGPVSGLELFQRPLTIRDLVTQGTTTSDTVEYARVTAITNNAAPVAEATSSAAPTAPASVPGALVNNANGGYKPESAFTTARATAVVKTIAHWIPATKRALSDAAQIMTLIDNFLEYGLEEELEDQMVSGDGSGENFDGIGHISGTQSQAWDTDLFTTTRKARTKVRTVGRARANGYVLNPADVEALDLLQDNEGRFYAGGPIGIGSFTNQTLWGLPVIESEAVPAGTGYVGDWTKAILWNRQQSTISITDSHADFFVRNLVAILAEMRAAFGVIQPSAFVEIDLAAA
jgi:HK97 family phage major capsid protein